ncbi:hypothetical protein [Pelagovum pacificum]|uniref:Uncharacterized protein n=1 Tax=Pelagovum pacificum TaxID=2588711 RepID=A0A5C5GEB0_9RHOB|nr:hypothetical protein [Pelagovum pacificum]QQA44529.1 hypothetical protein I8N54_08160 [Pelagovum pacificum]TNY32357.1 hypothetical protein FHY64_03420 [Pelagovum pacificum]
MSLFAPFLLLAACGESATAPVPEPVPVTAEGIAPGQSRALFAEHPAGLFAAAGAACNQPGQTLVEDSRNEIRCESLPPVEAAASLILEFDGTVDDLPRFVISFASRQSADGIVVTADNYINVPQQDGGVRVIRIPDTRTESVMRDVMARAGGVPF